MCLPGCVETNRVLQTQMDLLRSSAWRTLLIIDAGSSEYHASRNELRMLRTAAKYRRSKRGTRAVSDVCSLGIGR